MEKKDLVVNLELLNSKGNKGKVIRIEDDTFTILWVETRQFYDYPYDEGLLKSMVVERGIIKKDVNEDKVIEKVIEK